MSPDAQRAAIALACGFKWWTWDYRRYHTPEKCQLFMGKPNGANYPKGSEFRATLGKSKLVDAYYDQFEHVPDYLSDLNAMHEAESVLHKDWETNFIGSRMRYLNQLNVTCKGPSAFASAPQRAEAFLRTLNLWTD